MMSGGNLDRTSIVAFVLLVAINYTSRPDLSEFQAPL
jgi:hypothetical protein